MKKKINRKDLRKSIKHNELKYYYEFSVKKYVFYDSSLKKGKSKSSFSQKIWDGLRKVIFLFSQLAEIVKTIF